MRGTLDRAGLNVGASTVGAGRGNHRRPFRRAPGSKAWTSRQILLEDAFTGRGSNHLAIPHLTPTAAPGNPPHLGLKPILEEDRGEGCRSHCLLDAAGMLVLISCQQGLVGVACHG